MEEIKHRFGSRNDLLLRANPDAQLGCARNPKLSIICAAPTLTELNRTYGEKTSTAWLMAQLFDLSEYCGVKDKMDEVQIKKCAQVIESEFAFLKISELMLFFHWFKAAKYDRFYGSVDPLIILAALRNGFMRERAAIIEQHEREQRKRELDAHKAIAITYNEFLNNRKTD